MDKLLKKKGRAAQMNLGASRARGDVFFFLRADSETPPGFLQKMVLGIAHGANGGCFRLKFDSDHWFLKAKAWFTRFNFNAFRFGD